MKHNNLHDEVIAYLNTKDSLPSEYYFLRSDVVRWIWDTHDFLDKECVNFLKKDLELLLLQYIKYRSIRGVKKNLKQV